MESHARQSAENGEYLSRRRQELKTFYRLSTVVAGALCTAMLACHSTPHLTPQEQAGKHLYTVRCAHCHEDNDLALKKVPPDLHRLFERQSLPSGVPATDSNVRGEVLAGKGMMPSFAGRFTQDQMADLLAYLHTGLR